MAVQTEQLVRVVAGSVEYIFLDLVPDAPSQLLPSQASGMPETHILTH